MILPIEAGEEAFAQRVRGMFGPEGMFSKARNFEYREEQQQMAEAVARSLEGERHLIVEAGTGVGKSLAYLTPSLIYAKENARKALISTHTINLQEQLFNKDLPILEKLLPFEFEAALLKGRQNYCCPRRLSRARTSSKDLFVTSQVAELDRIWEWFQRTDDGTLSDMDVQPDPSVWSQVCSEPHLCTARKCGNDPKCFYQKARRRLISAEVVIMNHVLFFNYLGGLDEETESQEGYLFPNDFVVFDEAHNLESIAARHIGMSFSTGSFRYLLQRLYHPRTRKGILSLLRQPELERGVIDLLDRGEEFAGKLEKACEFGRGSEFRVKHPELVEDELSLPMMQLRQQLLDLATDIKEDEDSAQELRDAARRLAEQRATLNSFLAQSAEDNVYWVERTGINKDIFHLQAAPIDLAMTLKRLLFRPDHSAIFASATLSVGKGMVYFQRRVGGEEADTLQVDSPFDYSRQMEVMVPRRMPDPRDPGYEEGLKRWISFFVGRTGGRAFVLFTSYRLMHRMADALDEWFAEHDIRLLVQGSGMPRNQLLDAFKEDETSTLFGTDSFWQGVDVPGDALKNVIITRLPFAVPDHPLTEAKLEEIEARGGDPFKEFSLPEAILKFRQGVGRLIRTQSDSGIVVILDNRVLTKNYGKFFLAKVPDCPVRILDDDGEEEIPDPF